MPEATRGGEDIRRRGWFWHWNALVTQYAPLLGLKGVGLLNSYTVWTDRREESPHRGYAFPSQQSEADFYGEDRAELITINKILVALDLIEIRKEMVPRVDPQGRRWKVPHNFYRVKDHGDDFTLGAADVLRVAELAARDRAVYRYVRRVFSPRFAPIDNDNVWSRILPEVRRTPLWQELAAKAAVEENRASARTRAGHAARKGTAPDADAPAKSLTATPFFVTSARDAAARDADDNDSGPVTTTREEQTSVALTNIGLALDVDGSNTGSPRNLASIVAPVNEGSPTFVDPANTTYNQSPTTTKTDDQFERQEETARDEKTPASESGSPGVRFPRVETTGGPSARPPSDAAGQAAALRTFESANDRAATPAERKLLADLAARFEPVAEAASRERASAALPESGWGWVEAAIWEAVEAGSAYVAPRRVREILLRWEREGFPTLDGGRRTEDGESARRRDGETARRQDGQQARRSASRPTPPVSRLPPSVPPPFTIDEVGLSNRQVWAATLAEIGQRGDISRADLETWLRPAALIGRKDGALVVGAPSAVARERIATRLLPALRAALTATVGVPLAVEVVVAADHDGQVAS